MPLTHDMGLIGFHLVMFINRVHGHLMPTELFIRRPLLWLTFAARVRASILCSPNFGYKHYLKVLGERPVESLDLSAVRYIFNGAEPISVELCEEFLARLAPAQLKRNAMFPVYGLAEASLAVSFPQEGAPLRTLRLNRHRMGVGTPVVAGGRVGPRRRAAGLRGPRRSPTAELRIADDEDRELPADRIGNIHISGENVTRGYFEDPPANAAAFSADGWLRTGDLGLIHDGELFVSGRAKEIIFVNGQNYYPHDLETIAQRVPGLELGKVVAAGVRPSGAQFEQLVVFVLHRGGTAEFLPLATQVARVINEQAGIEVAEVVPVKRIPKTTSGKIQRHLLEESYADGEFQAELAELAALRAAQRGPQGATAQRDRGQAQGDLRCGARGQAHRHPRQPLRGGRELAEADRDPRADRSRVPGQDRAHRAVRFPHHRRARAPPAKQAAVTGSAARPQAGRRASDSQMPAPIRVSPEARAEDARAPWAHQPPATEPSGDRPTGVAHAASSTATVHITAS